MNKVQKTEKPRSREASTPTGPRARQATQKGASTPSRIPPDARPVNGRGAAQGPGGAPLAQLAARAENLEKKTGVVFAHLHPDQASAVRALTGRLNTASDAETLALLAGVALFVMNLDPAGAETAGRVLDVVLGDDTDDFLDAVRDAADNNDRRRQTERAVWLDARRSTAA